MRGIGLLCYSGERRGKMGGYDGSGVHLTTDERRTVCGRDVVDVPRVPRVIAPLSCLECSGWQEQR